jgi:hypothetical protein
MYIYEAILEKQTEKTDPCVGFKYNCMQQYRLYYDYWREYKAKEEIGFGHGLIPLSMAFFFHSVIFRVVAVEHILSIMLYFQSLRLSVSRSAYPRSLLG